jgi:hypothetical protein
MHAFRPTFLAVALVLTAALAVLGATAKASPALQVPAGADSQVVPSQAGTQTPPRLFYQGRLWDDQARQWINGRQTLVFRIWDSQTGGRQLWTGTERDVIVSNGLLQVALDVQQALFNGRDLWLEVQVEGDADPMVPRTELLPAPYALGLLPGATIDGETNTAVLRVFNRGGRLGLLDMGSHGIQASSGYTGTAGVYGSSAFGYGIQGISAESIGVFGFGGRWVGAPPRPTGHYGVLGLSQTAAGVYGHSQAAAEPGILGEGSAVGVSGRAMTGVLGEGDVGVKGTGTVGVSGEGTTGVSGDGTGAGVSATGDDTGVRAEGGKIGVSGTTKSTETTGIGIEGKAQGRAVAVKGSAEDGFGGSFWSTTNIGVYGLSSASAFGVAVSGRHGVYGAGGTKPGDYGGYFVGNSGVLGREVPDTAEGLAGRFEGDVTVTDALVVEGPATFRGGKSGYVVDVCLSDDPGTLRRGDVVVVTGVAPSVIGQIPVPRVRRTSIAGDSGVVGVVDQRVVPGQSRDASPTYLDGPIGPGQYLSVVTLGAFAGVCTDASFGAVKAGDLLVTSPTAGCAMRSGAPAVGTVIAKALGALPAGVGNVPALVTLH